MTLSVPVSLPSSTLLWDLWASNEDIGDKLQLKFKHVRDAFRPLNLQRPQGRRGLQNRAKKSGQGASGWLSLVVLVCFGSFCFWFIFFGPLLILCTDSGFLGPHRKPTWSQVRKDQSRRDAQLLPWLWAPQGRRLGRPCRSAVTLGWYGEI